MEENSTFPTGQSPKALGKLTERCERTHVYAPDGYGRMRMSPDGRFAALNNGIRWNLEMGRCGRGIARSIGFLINGEAG